MSMRPFGSGVIGIDAARAIIARSVPLIARTEDVDLPGLRGRVLARDIVATLDVPPFDRASMDGYAVWSADTAGASRQQPTALRLAGRAYTGDAPAAQVSAGTCVEIATGAPIPAGADAVVMVEETSIDGDTIRVTSAVSPRQNIGPRGADISAGQTVLRAGETLNPSRIGAIAALGLAGATVWARPRVAVLSTGNEIAGQGRPLEPGEIYDINRYTLAGVVADNGGETVALDPARDTLEAIRERLDTALGCDMVVFSGGSSVGERDLIIDVVRERGEVLFHGIAVKPGKPTSFATIKGIPVFGMPGYPTSCLSNAYILLAPALRQMARLPAAQPRTFRLPLAAPVTSVAGRHQFYSVRVEDGRAVPAFKASGDITSMSRADGYIEIAADVTRVEAGETVLVTLF